MDEIIEDKLILLDITPKTKIIMRTEDDKLYVSYMVCFTELGHQFLLDIDVEGKTRDDTKEIFIDSRNSPSKSLIRGELEKMNNMISGVALICDNNICIVERSDDKKPEVNLEFEGNKFFEGNLKLPMIRMSELLHIPKEMISYINEASLKISRERLNTEERTLNNFKKNMEYLNDNFKQLIKIRESFLDNLNKSYEALMENYNMFDENTKTQKGYELLKYNLRRRRMLEGEINQSTIKLKDLDLQIRDLNDDIISIRSFYEENLSKVSDLYQPVKNNF